MAGIEMKYKGGGFIPKVPARDLSADEVKQFGHDRLLRSGLYEDVKKPKPKKAKAIKVAYEDEVQDLSDELEAIEETFEED